MPKSSPPMPPAPPLMPNEIARTWAGRTEARSEPIRARWNFSDPITADGHRLRCTFACSLRPLSDAAERKMLGEVFLARKLSATIDDLPARIEFDDARVNLYAAAREGLGAHVTWFDGKQMLAQQLILDHLLPLAKAGLDRAGADAEDSARYLGIVERRVRTGRNGARWMLQSLSEMKGRGSTGAQLNALTAAMIAR